MEMSDFIWQHQKYARTEKYVGIRIVEIAFHSISRFHSVRFEPLAVPADA